MPRTARKRDKNRPHHIMSRSIPELNLFNCDEDREYYLTLMKTASKVYGITIIAYCLMDNHVHLLVHPYGGDISKFMKNINNTYAKHFNRTYQRRGHLYDDRFRNIIIKDEIHLIRTSTYIHNNPKDLLWKGYKGVEEYPYSSILDFIKPGHGRGLVDPSLVYRYMNDDGVKVRNHYRALLEIQSQGYEEFERELEEAFRKGEYKNDRKAIVRDTAPSKVLSALSNLTGNEQKEQSLHKYSRSERVCKCLAAICLRIFCDMTLRELTSIFRGYTSARIGQFSKAGFDMMESMGLYDKMVAALSD